MALIQSTLIWVVYAVYLAVALLIATIFVINYQAPRERSAFLTTISIVTLTSLLATALLLPVDVALVSSATSSKLGRRKEWATPDQVDSIRKTLEIVYYLLYTLDTLLCLIVVPFAYFWHEELDEVETEEGRQTVAARFWGAFKYTVGFVVFVVIIFLIGFFLPLGSQKHAGHYDLDYFRYLLQEGHGERALTFALGLITLIGTLTYAIYTAAGMALLPITLIKSAPGISAPALSANTTSELAQNRERQHQLELRGQGQQGSLSTKDRRELEALVREERTLVRRERLANEAKGDGQGRLLNAWIKLEAIFRPVKLIGGLLLIILVVLVWVSMLLTFIDKAKNSVCKARCGYILGHVNIFNPVNYVLVKAARIFPIDYLLFLLLITIFFASSIVGVVSIGVRFLWLRLFQIRKGHTAPQGLLLASLMLAFMILAINYAAAMLIAPQYAHFGPQTYCDRPLRHPDDQPDCSKHKSAIKPCSEVATNQAARNVCIASVGSTFLDRITLNFSFFGVISFWAQLGFLAVFLIVFTTSLFRTPKLDQFQVDQDIEEAEEEGLLASTARRFGATWQDVRGSSGEPASN